MVEKKNRTVNKELRKHIKILTQKKHGEIKKKEIYKVIEHKYRTKKKGLNVVPEELKQRMQLRPPTLRACSKN